MTIPTVGNAEKPKEAQVLINPETMVKVEFKRAQRDSAARQQRKVHAAINELIHSRRRRYLAMNIVVAIASLLVVVTGIFGGMYIYKWISYSSKVAAQGECTIRYHDELRSDSYAQAQVQMQQATQAKAPRRGGNRDEDSRRHGPRRQPPPLPSQGQLQPQWQPHQRQFGAGANGRFVEKYNVLNANQEIFQVPQVGFSPFGMLSINVIHDFTAKLTAIVDVWNGRCLVKPLDPSVVPPRSFVDMMRRIEDGTYVPNVCLIRKHYKAQQPALDAAGLAALRSDIISRSCSSLATYQLVRIDSASTLPPATNARRLIGGDEDFNRPVEADARDESDDEPPVVFGGEADPDNPMNQARRQRTKRSAEVESSEVEQGEEEVPFETDLDESHNIVKKTSVEDAEADADNNELLLGDADDDDLVVNVGFDGANVEVALIHFDDDFETSL